MRVISGCSVFWPCARTEALRCMHEFDYVNRHPKQAPVSIGKQIERRSPPLGPKSSFTLWKPCFSESFLCFLDFRLYPCTPHEPKLSWHIDNSMWVLGKQPREVWKSSGTVSSKKSPNWQFGENPCRDPTSTHANKQLRMTGWTQRLVQTLYLVPETRRSNPLLIWITHQNSTAVGSWGHFRTCKKFCTTSCRTQFRRIERST